MTATLDVAAVFAALDHKDADAFGGFLAPDASYTLGNHDTVVGRDEIVAGTAAFLASLASLRHDLINVWQVDGGFVAHVLTTVTRPDGKAFPMPAAIVSRTSDGLITDHRVFIDISPLAS